MDIRPFQGWRFACDAGSDVGPCIAPPYDVLTAEDKQELLARDAGNIVAVDLPHVPPKDVGPDEEYDAAAALLADWKANGRLQQETAPALYAYEQTYSWAGTEYVRRAMICGVRATELGGDVIPHEHTFPGPKADRFKLTEVTRMQLSPIFGFYDEPAGEAAEALWAAVHGEPDAQGQLRDVAERIWAVTDPAVIQGVAAALRDVPVFIADGHHRYTTALTYRDMLAVSGQIDENHEANFVMFVLAAASDPGLLIHPTHRVVRGLTPDFSVHKLMEAATEFTWQRCSVEDADLRNADAFLHRYGPGAMAFIDAEPAEVWIARLTSPEAMHTVAPDQPEVWRELDVAILHKLIIDKALAPWRTDDVVVDYTPEGMSALAACESGRAQLAVFLQSTPLSAVQANALAGASMPHKSTYFYPKVATGMVLKPLA